MTFYGSDYVRSDSKPRWDAIGNLSGDLRQFIEDLRYLDSIGNISNSNDVRSAVHVICNDNYTSDEKAAAIEYLDKRKKLVDAKLQGVDYSMLIEMSAELLKGIYLWNSFGLRNADIKMLDAQYNKKAKILRDAAYAELQAKVRAEREECEKERNEKLNKNFRVASALIEKAFDDNCVTRTSHRDSCSDNTEHKLGFPIWMFNDDTNRCYCVDVQRGGGNHKHEWFYSVMCSCNVLPGSSYSRYNKGVTSSKNYQIKALSCDLEKIVPVDMKDGHFVMNDELASICSDDRKVQPLRSLADIDTSGLGDNIIEEHDVD